MGICAARLEWLETTDVIENIVTRIERDSVDHGLA
jgi:hypothetical protein